MDKKTYEEYLLLEKELLNSLGYRWETNIFVNLLTTYKVFQGNSLQLIKLLEWYDSGKESQSLLALKNREKANAFLQEIVRNYHNYLASVSSLVDHTRFIKTNLDSEGFGCPDYSDHIRKHFKTPQSQFIQQSRNYMLHRKCIFTGWHVTFEAKGTSKQYITISLDELKEWDKWNPLSKVFIEHSNNNPRLLPLIHEYTKNVDDFYNWYVGYLNQALEKAFTETNEIREKMRKLAGIDQSK